MKKINLLSTFLFCVFSYCLMAQVPQSINYQAIARDADGCPLTEETIDIQITIRKDSANNNNIIYREDHSPTTSPNGYFKLLIGQGDNAIGDFDQIDWYDSPYFLNVKMGNEDMGTSRIVSVPYALFAERAQSVENDEVDDADADPDNEIQELVRVGNQVFLDPGQGSVTVDDADADPENEIQELLLSGNTLSLVRQGGSASVDLPMPAAVWQEDGTDIFYGEGNVYVRNSSSSNENLVSFVDGGNGRGFVVAHKSGIDKAYMFGSDLNTGVINTLGENGNLNVLIASLEDYPNHGAVGVFDSDNNQQAGMYVKSTGEGVIFADCKNFRMDHPQQSDKEIWYACIEGPEAAAYERGTATLTNGETFVPFSEHFQWVANHETMTVVLTPLSSNTVGLAVIGKSAGGFKVKELMNGAGNFDFDWEVKCVRKGYEDYKVIRSKREDLPAH
ncbi:MAG: hypothetical protein AAFZ15_32350 [Bacteroidota bacterium]